MEIAHIQTPLGIAKIGNENGIPLFLFQMKELFHNCPVLQAAVTQLNEYFEGKRHSFSFKLNPQGTEFQQKYGKLDIPYGKTRTYLEQSKR
jgi:methylated-DNA-[protein]-cysteine S-methyltransferase